MGRYRRKKTHNKNKIYSAHLRRKEVKDPDQIYHDMEQPEKANPNEGDDDLPGCGRFYCISCARYFINEAALEVHNKSKLHRRKLKVMQKGEVYFGPDERIDNGKKIVRPDPEE